LFSSNGGAGVWQEVWQDVLGCALERLKGAGRVFRREADEFGDSYNSHFDFLHRHFNHGCRLDAGAATKCTRTGVIEIMSVAGRL
jgi:hypothetical protein